MRIITGKRRGLRLLTLEGEDTRPTADRVKEALFSMLADRVSGAKVLDLFAGSGALGLECISRGAERCDFVEANPKAADVVKKNIEKAQFTQEATLCRVDFRQFLKGAASAYDLIFLDPPYRSGFYQEALRMIAERELLAPGGRIIAEWDVEKPEFLPFTEEKEKAYGRVHISILRESME